ncbi:hst4p protein [Ilyonectria robusta]
MADCPECEKEQSDRASAGKRRRTIGFLRTNVLLYGENCPNEASIIAAFNHAIAQPIDAVLIVGTRLSIPSLAGFAKRLCRVVRETSPDNLVIWLRLSHLTVNLLKGPTAVEFSVFEEHRALHIENCSQCLIIEALQCVKRAVAPSQSTMFISTDRPPRGE